MIIESLAWCCALLSCLLSVPQLVRALRGDRLDGVSATTYLLVLANATVWGVWAILVGQYAAGVPALVNGPAAVLILARLHRAPSCISSRWPCRVPDGESGGEFDVVRATRSGVPVREPRMVVWPECSACATTLPSNTS
jgi:uncharacterized protein with PQ loop repeat